MSKRRRSSRNVLADQTRLQPRTRKIVFGVLGIVVFAALMILCRPLPNRMVRRMATNALHAGAIYDAQRWLAWSPWCGSDGGQSELLQAACYRHLQQVDDWTAALRRARREGAPANRLEQEMLLANTRSGNLYEEGANPLGDLIDSGLRPNEVAAAYVHGYLAREEPAKARLVLESWAADSPEDVQRIYMQGVVERWSSRPAQAEAAFTNVLDTQPRHDLARAALAQMLEEQNRLEQALSHYVELAARAPQGGTAALALARLLRKMGRYDQARAVQEKSLSGRPDGDADWALEMAQIEVETGDYEAAEKWFGKSAADPAREREQLAVRAIMYSLVGDARRAEELYTHIDAVTSRSIRSYDLRVRLELNPLDPDARGEMQSLSLPLTKPQTDRKTSPATGPDLYAQHCTACHGANGDGNGRAARFLYPRPRDLRTDRFRLASTSNGVPTLDDIRVVIQRGMPGTSMPAYDHLSGADLELLTREVQRLQREGAREQMIAYLNQEGETPDEEEVLELIGFRITPGEVVPLPPIGLPDAASIARGRETYVNLGCHNCHGDDGTGNAGILVPDDRGNVTRPRDLARELFKGGQEPESIYLRIQVGMPGTPHPACTGVSEQQVIDLVHYCCSLSREPKNELTNHERDKYATSSAYLAAFDEAATR